MLVVVGNFYAVQNGMDIKVVGPHVSWQDACVKAFGVIMTKLRVKCIGNDAYLIRKKDRVDAILAQEEGWFNPYIPTSSTGITFISDDALGPPEIAAKMTKLADDMLKADDVEALKIAWDEATPLLRFLNLAMCEKFTQLYNTKLIVIQQRGQLVQGNITFGGQ